nr:hypothetical protein orf185 [Navicula sp.]
MILKNLTSFFTNKKTLFIVVKNLIKLIIFLIVSIIEDLYDIFRIAIRNPIILFLLFGGFWVNSLTLLDENNVKNDITLLDESQTFNSTAEYEALTSSSKTVNLAAFRGKVLVDYNLEVEGEANSFNSNFRIISKQPDGETIDVRASIPEKRILAKLYHAPSFGVKVPSKVDLKRARQMATHYIPT